MIIHHHPTELKILVSKLGLWEDTTQTEHYFAWLKIAPLAADGQTTQHFSSPLRPPRSSTSLLPCLRHANLITRRVFVIDGIAGRPGLLIGTNAAGATSPSPAHCSGRV